MISSENRALTFTGQESINGQSETLSPVYNPSATGWMQDRGVKARRRPVMANIRIYKLYSTGVATTSASATITIPRNGLITAIRWGALVVGGASVSTGALYELSTSSVSTVTSNDTPGNSLSTLAIAQNVSGGSIAHNETQTNLGVPVTAGDKLYIHIQTNGTAPAAALVSCHVAIMH